MYKKVCTGNLPEKLYLTGNPGYLKGGRGPLSTIEVAIQNNQAGLLRDSVTTFFFCKPKTGNQTVAFYAIPMQAKGLNKKE